MGKLVDLEDLPLPLTHYHEALLLSEGALLIARQFMWSPNPCPKLNTTRKFEKVQCVQYTCGLVQTAVRMKPIQKHRVRTLSSLDYGVALLTWQDIVDL